MTITGHVWRTHAWDPPIEITSVDDPRAPAAASLSLLPANAWNTNYISTGVTSHSLWTEGTTQYVVWARHDRSHMISARTLPDGAWSSFDLSTVTGNPLGVQAGSDGHNYYVVGVDPDGYIHVAGNMHSANPIRGVKSANPHDITSWVAETSQVGTEEDDVTYPRFVRSVSGGPLFFMYRDGGAPTADIYLNRIEAGGAWQRDALVINGSITPVGAYPGVHVDTSGRLHMFWCWRYGGPNQNQDICYAVRETDGTWHKSNGDAYTMPITVANAETVVAIPQGGDLFNAFSVDTDSAGNPHATYLSGQGGNTSQVFHLTHNGTAWVNQAVTNLSVHVNMGSLGSEATAMNIAPPVIVIDDQDRPFMLLRVRGDGKEGTVRAINAIDSTETVLVDLEGGDMRFAIDGRAGKLRNELHFLAAPAWVSPLTDADSVPIAVASVDLATL